MRPKIQRAITVPSGYLAVSGSIPAEIGLASPRFRIFDPRPLEHPHVMTTAAGVQFFPMEPTNDSSLALGHPPSLLPEDSGR
jgi:hypothetical protein